MKNFILLTLLFIVLVIGLVWALDIGLQRKEKAECNQWKTEVHEFVNWQYQQCNRYGIKLNNYDR